jgi:hypothetical protein
MGCMVPQSFVAGGNQSYLELWAVTGGPRYPGYKTPMISHMLQVNERSNQLDRFIR